MLIQRHDPALLLRLRTNLRAIAINYSRTGYLRYLRLCVLNRSSIDIQTVDEIALDLAHEGAHAVLHRIGFRNDEAARERLEHACVRAELRLARRLPDGGRHVERLQSKFGQVWWTDEDLRLGREAELRTAQWPEWLISLRRWMSS